MFYFLENLNCDEIEVVPSIMSHSGRCKSSLEVEASGLALTSSLLIIEWCFNNIKQDFFCRFQKMTSLFSHYPSWESQHISHSLGRKNTKAGGAGHAHAQRKKRHKSYHVPHIQPRSLPRGTGFNIRISPEAL